MLLVCTKVPVRFVRLEIVERMKAAARGMPEDERTAPEKTMRQRSNRP